MTATETRALVVGQVVFCTVHGGAYGWWKVAAIRQRDGYIKLAGGPNLWCPPHNFRLTEKP